MKKIIFLSAFVFSLVKNYAQELNCQVSIIAAPGLQIGPVEKEIFTELEASIYDFMNNTRWTTDVFEIEERINCNVLLTISEMPTTTTFSGKVQIQSSRPVYNTGYNTVLFNFEDNDVTFNYVRNSALLFSIDQYRDNLTSILAFYAYMILAYDYDSFELKGGTKYFNKAQIIANNAKNSGDPGWAASAGKKNNRYWMVDNALQSVFEPIRVTYYNYHRLGFDIMYDDIVGGRKAVLESLQLLDKVQRARPGSLNLQIFLTSKSDELVNLFSQAEITEKNAVVSVLKKLDPTNSSKYQEILN
ncbi:MAG: DUF4835 family protein [Crocinitomicaceae bacterium]|nr:DUF4835 family protein [Crocinitomicaceae bacterium]